MASDNARTFTIASSEKITFSLGALGFAFGPGTIAVILSATAVNVAQRAFSAGATTGVSYVFGLNTSGNLQLGNNNTFVPSTFALSAATWYLAAVTKATGTVAPRFHLFNYTTGAWTHTDSGSTLANSSVPITRAALAVDPSGTAAFFGGSIYAAAAWSIVLTDVQVEALIQDVTLGTWSVAGIPKAWWKLNQQSVGTSLTDQTGGGANQSAITGTSVGSFPFAPDPTLPIGKAWVYMRGSTP